MSVAYLTRRERFSAAHRLFKPELSDSENIKLYGQCSHSNWHGHNYELFVTIKGEIDPNTGYVVNLKTLGNIIKEEVISKVDHRNLNIDVDFMHGVVTSTENLAVAIWNCLDEPITRIGAKLYKIRIQETENNYIEFYGE
jgi:6-pyruvoyltetrahydropterin/6-carboxytetrahydropterin synthase